MSSDWRDLGSLSRPAFQFREATHPSSLRTKPLCDGDESQSSILLLRQGLAIHGQQQCRKGQSCRCVCVCRRSSTQAGRVILLSPQARPPAPGEVPEGVGAQG